MKTLSQLLAAAVVVNVNGFSVGSDIIKEAVEKELAANRERIVNQVRNLMNSGTEILKQRVVDLRRMREQAKKQKEKVDKTDRAVRYMLETGNPLPYLYMMGDSYQAGIFCTLVKMEMPEWDDKTADYQVPADWKPTETADVPAVE